MDAVGSIVRRSARDGWPCVWSWISGCWDILELELGKRSWSAVDARHSVSRDNINAVMSWVCMLLAARSRWSMEQRRPALSGLFMYHMHSYNYLYYCAAICKLDKFKLAFGLEDDADKP
jgi:hypothetical protein